MVNIAPKLPPVPPPPPIQPQLDIAPSIAPTVEVTPAQTSVITSPMASTFQPPLPNINSLTTDRPPSNDSTESTNPTATGTQAGPKEGEGSDKPADKNNEIDAMATTNIAGLTMYSSENLIVAVDVSGSMLKVDAVLRPMLQKSFGNITTIPCGGCVGRFIPAEDGTLTPATGGNELDYDMYHTIYEELDPRKGKFDPNNPPTAILLITDFEDGGSPQATKAFIDYLRNNLIRLYVYSVENAPYPQLADYAKFSGGSVFITAKYRVTSLAPPAAKPQPSP
jgi:hypothetical protein